jgi:hypothetical protein
MALSPFRFAGSRALGKLASEDANLPPGDGGAKAVPRHRAAFAMIVKKLDAM